MDLVGNGTGSLVADDASILTKRSGLDSPARVSFV